MISVTEIVLIIAGFAAIIIGYLLPAGKELDEEDKVLMEREIRELVRREVEDQKDTIDDMVGDSVENSLDRTERAMERISNEKMSAIGEYSDTVINDIHKNHDEVMFMYDMLNDKHKNLTSVVTEVTKKADEAKKVVMDAEATAREAQEATDALKNVKESTEDAPVSASAPAPSPVSAAESSSDAAQARRTVLVDDDSDRLSGIRIPSSEEKAASTEPSKETIRPDESGYIERDNIRELDKIPAEVISDKEASKLHVIGNTVDSSEIGTESKKVVPIKEAVRVEGRSKNPDTSMKELTANDPVSQNRQIIEMHKQGKSNMVIARELGLGIGEVKLVIDLSNKHRKVR